MADKFEGADPDESLASLMRQLYKRDLAGVPEPVKVYIRNVVADLEIIAGNADEDDL